MATRTGVPRFAWPASGFRVAFSGTELALRLADRLYQDDVRDTDYLAVYVDDATPVTVALREGVGEYRVAHGLKPGEHEVRVLKRTEADAGTIELLGLQAGGGGRFLARPARRARSVLAIGDSITAGYGVDGPNESCHFSGGTSNATRTYAFLAARALDAEIQVLAWSGRGVYRNYDADEAPVMPELYDLAIPTEPESRVDPSTYSADTVVVNLGTNDLYRPRPNRGRFIAAYVALAARLRHDQPSATIVLIVGPMLADDYPPHSNALRKARAWVASVVAARRAAGDARISMLEFRGAMPDEGYGCDFHPSARSHQRMASELVAHLQAR